jgi:hypothetical protein
MLSFESLERERGITSENPLEDKFRYRNLGTMSDNEAGKGPEKALPDKSRDLILVLVQFMMNCGKVPLRSLLARSNSFKLDIGEKLA